MKTYEEIIPNLVHRGKIRGLNINVKNPVTIQDKIAWLIVYDSTPLKTRCADKIQVHDYCKEKLGEDICVPILKVWDKVEDINWDELPNQFVIKCNHGSGMNIIVKDKAKLDIADAKRKLTKWMNTDFSKQVNDEMHYHDIPRKIFVEEYMFDDNQKDSLFDYKFWCFNGEPKMYTINDGEGHGDIMYYDMEHNEMNLYFLTKCNKYNVPKNFDDMVEKAKILSKDFKFVRVDFYEINGVFYLGELTFTPGAGLFRYKQPGANEKVGNMLNLNNNIVKDVIETKPDKNVVIVNFNTQKLTDACIKSINKHTKGGHIYVFDNSDKIPFINTFDNVEVINNTKQQIVNFDEVLLRHDARLNSHASDNNFGSLKHCMAVDYMFDVIDDGFVLFDSDTLIKRDFSDLFDENVIYCGQREQNSLSLKVRVAPYALFINTKMCREKGIRFFDEGHMLGLHGAGNEPERYDTGAWFYEKTNNLPKKEIRYNHYIIHFRAGSWLEDAKAKQNYKPIYSEDTWLNMYKLLWQ